ncbi:hypothetical protein GCM10007416_34190 [Kroppenstedtia guangzhouensis]|uniref:Uncharacterized protein n=1 Tax=Kroppenstedtia guangzhouensis TaxID=1274356 RepID=A0ABQ1H5C1_9BACL|nr:hypothetical protein [Kroppenstedtia guangzhouensis]GGA58144.1 hypothetical protein GCM10007416_34190 [Kroppenstedtia guangzhouensis]
MKKVTEIMEQIAKLKATEQVEIYRRLGELLKSDNGRYKIPDGHDIIR